MSRRIAPGIWIDANGDGHFSIPELLTEFVLEDTKENREFVANLIRDMLSKLNPA